MAALFLPPPILPSCPTFSRPISAPSLSSYPPSAPYIPQTIEHALRLAQQATSHALQNSHSNLRIELPMGRSRKFWYRPSPVSMSLIESRLICYHFISLFRTLRTLILLPPNTSHPSPSTLSVQFLDETPSPTCADVVAIAAVPHNDWPVVQPMLNVVNEVKAVIAINCAMDGDVANPIEGFDDVYVCRMLDKVAVLKEGVDHGWAVFMEIAVFEYEYVCNMPPLWKPTQKSIETVLMEKGARKKGLNGYYQSRQPGCEAGFWPFMTHASVDVLPISGEQLEQKQAKQSTPRLSKRPFGFF